MTENHNGKRSNIISSLKRKNLKLVNQIKKEIKSMKLNSNEMVQVHKLEKNLTQCANLTLYQKDGSLIKHVASHTCDNKICHVCNYLRQKKVRRKYYKWFDDNSTFFEIVHNNKSRFVTKYQLHNKEKYSGAEVLNSVNYDIVHLTLTVPHTEDKGFRGELFYQRKIRTAFNLMRKTPQWLSMAYGGEFGIEITKKSNGLHIHIHALVFIKREFRNRNKFHRIVLKQWNKYTIDPDYNYKSKEKQAAELLMSPQQRKNFNNQEYEIFRAAVKKGNQSITDEDVEILDRRGATFINMETIFSSVDGKKVRATEYGSKEMLFAVMEAISYHFKPTTFDSEDGKHNLRLMIKLLPALYNLRIYDRFGVLYQESPLNMKNNTYIEDLEEVLDIKDSEGGLVSQYEYFITNPAFVFHATDKNNKIILSKIAKERLIDLNAANTNDALGELNDLVKAMHLDNFNYS